MRQSTFMLDATAERVFEGFATNDLWNGWSTPLFNFGQARQIMAAWQEQGWEARYDEDKDAFIFSVNQDFETGKSDDFEEFASVERDGHKLYPIGAFAWTWEESEAIAA